MEDNGNSQDSPFKLQGQSAVSEQPESVAVTREEFNALKQEFDAFKQKTETLAKKPPPAPPPEDSSFVEYLPWILVIILAAVVAFMGLKLSSVIQQLNWLREQHKKLAAAAAEEKKPVVSYSAETYAAPTTKPPTKTSPPAATGRLTASSVQKNPSPPTSEEKPKNLFNGVNFIAQCIRDFNAADGEDTEWTRDAFARKYNVLAFNCTNVEERLNNTSLPPQFGNIGSISSSDYWAVKIAENRYVVFPNVHAYNWNIHLRRAMNYFFDAPNFNADKTYNKIFVDTPAEMDGNFECTAKGILRLSDND